MSQSQRERDGERRLTKKAAGKTVLMNKCRTSLIIVLGILTYLIEILVSQNGSLGNSCKDSGGHYNPNQKNHGSLNAAERHEGDFGNIVADNQGVATISVARWVVLLPTLTAGRNDFLWRLHKALVK